MSRINLILMALGMIALWALSMGFLLLVGFIWKYIKPILKIIGLVFLLICAVGMLIAPEMFGAVGFFAIAILCFVVARIIFAVIKGLSD